MRVLVVAGTGFIGGHVARTFLARGAEVSTLVRSRAHADGDPRLTGAQCVIGDLAAIPDEILATPRDVVVYAAGAWQRDARSSPAQIEDRCRTVYVHGVDRLAERATAWKAHFVFLSGITRFGDAPFDAPLTESTPPGALTIYGRYKRRAEELLARRGERGLRWTALCPHDVYGAHDGGSYVRFMYRRIRARRFFHLGDGRNRWSLCNVGNVADAAVDLADRDGLGPLLIADERPSSHDEVARALAVAAHRRPRFVHVPRALALALAAVNARLPRPRSLDAAFSPRHVRLRTSTILFDTSRALRAGVIARHRLEEGLQDAVAWWEGPGRDTL